MEITVKLYAMLGSYLPPGTKYNQAQLEVADEITVAQLIETLKLPIELTHLVLVNGVYVDPNEREQTRLCPGDEFVVFPPVAGG